MARNIYRVTPNGTRWELKFGGVVLYSHDNKDPVVERGRAEAKANQPSQLIVHETDGTFGYEHTYGDDPYPPSG